MTSLPTHHAIAGLIAAQALYMSTGAAIAAAPTDVNPAPQIQNPYQQTASIPDSSTCAPQCIAKFPAVPSGKRLVVTNVSARAVQRSRLGLGESEMQHADANRRRVAA
jgi:hypothetical protein